MFELLAGPIVEAIAKLAKKEASNFLQKLLTNEKAAVFAIERLRPKYERAVLPAVYENIASNFQLASQDFIDYFAEQQSPTIASLDNWMRSRLRMRASNWVHNRPTEQLFSDILDDFYRAYETFFIITDPKLATLEVLGASREILAIVSEMRKTLAQLNIKSSKGEGGTFCHEIKILMTALQMPFEVLESTSKCMCFKIIDPSGIFPSEIFVCASEEGQTTDTIETISRTIKDFGHFAHSILVTPESLDEQRVKFAERRGITTIQMKAFRERLLYISPGEHYVVGNAAIDNLLESLAVRDVYVEPTCAKIKPGDEDTKLGVGGIPVFSCIDGFLDDKEANILFVLGEYGCGKSALCAQIARRLTVNPSKTTPVYVALRQAKSADGLSLICSKASQIAKTVGDSDSSTVVILDGLDELPDAMKPQERRQNMLRLLDVSKTADKVIVAARSSYFRGLEDFWEFFSHSGESPLWERLATRLPRKRPNVVALVLNEFNNDQIEQYLVEAAKQAGRKDDFVEEFLRSLETYDPMAMYRFIARSPLYLFLLVNTEPWNDPNVRCTADVLELLIKFWLERDIEKGVSRWGFTTFDRLDFMYGIAWWMFQKRVYSVTYSEFDAFVKQFYKMEDRECDALILDLHTTGLFGCSDKRLRFILPAFFDFLVASQFANFGFTPDMPGRLPTRNQALIWLGLLETGRADGERWGRSDISDLGIISYNEQSNCVLEIKTKEGTRQCSNGGLPVHTKGVLYHAPMVGFDWPESRKKNNVYARVAISAGIAVGEVVNGSYVRIYLGNKFGLHARASACIVNSISKWKAGKSLRQRAALWIQYGGERVNAGSLLGLMMLAASRGSIIELVYENCSEEDIDEILMELKAERTPSSNRFDWRINEFWF